MKKIAVIGAGQLGSRHLQALGLSDFETELFVVDPNLDSISVSKERFTQVPENKNVKKISFLQNITNLPSHIDLAIIATNADVRLDVLRILVKHVNVSFLILEKILFQSVSDYTVAESLFSENNIKAWVNCPRRMFPFYQELKKYLTEGNIHYEVSGINWGLACNSIHFIDHMAMYVGKNNYALELSGLDQIVHQSKRSGYVEFTGTLTGSFAGRNQQTFSLTSKQGKNISLKQNICNDRFEISIAESKAEAIILDKKEQTEEIISFDFMYQSSLSHIAVKNIFETGNCQLTPYQESMQLHLPFLKKMNQFLSQISDHTSTVCPIT